MKIVIIFLCLALTAVSSSRLTSDILHVISHDKVMVVTDPAKGYNAYRNRTAFPSDSIDYRKVILNITYQCPDSLHCGEWDYIDEINLIISHDSNPESDKIELARMISPYGWWFDSSWQFTWRSDITDFSILLHDSVDIEFVHTGYESNSDRGWLITLDFEIYPGRPAMPCLGMDTLWCGSFAYGDSAKPIENYLHPILINRRDGARAGRLRINQTGHGMDDLENCAEFCNKYRQVYLDDSLIEQKPIWRLCGDNPLYPQAGTWIFDRANWCPGGVVKPDIYDFLLNSDSEFVIDMEMEPYFNPGQPTANYYIQSYFFWYGLPWAENDVSLEQIIIPSRQDEFSRYNPAGANPKILIKNNGYRHLNSCTINYGTIGSSPHRFDWRGDLESQKMIEIDLPGIIDYSQELTPFEVHLEFPNGETDEYMPDNQLISEMNSLPIYPEDIILEFRTNNDSLQNSAKLVDDYGRIYLEHSAQSIKTNSIYRDTLHLLPGNYQLFISDSAGDGLEFWFNREGGYGYVRILDISERLLKNFTPDFGSFINYWFTVMNGVSPVPDTAIIPIAKIFPSSNEGKFDVDLFFNDSTDLSIEIFSDSLNMMIFNQAFNKLKAVLLPIDINNQPNGIYWLKIIAETDTTARKFRIRKTE